MKRVVSSSIITLFIIVAITITYFYLRNFNKSGGDPVNAIPADASFVLVYNPLQFHADQLKKTEFWSLLCKAPSFSSLNADITFIDSLQKSNEGFKDFFSNQPWYISAHVTGADQFDFLFLKAVSNDLNESTVDKLVSELAGEAKNAEERNYDGNSIREINLNNGRLLSYTFSKGVFIASFTPFIVEDALRQLKLGKPITDDFNKLEQNIQSSGLDLYINFNNVPSFLSIFLEPSKSQGSTVLKKVGGWGAGAITPSGSVVKINGFVNTTDTLQLVNCFNGQQPVDKKMLKILPRQTAVINYYGFTDINLFYRKYWSQYSATENAKYKETLIRSVAEKYKLRIEDKFLDWIGNEFALIITEPTGVNFDNNCFAVFKTKKVETAKNALKTISRIVDKESNSKTMEEPYNGHVIGYIGLNGVLPALFGESFTRITKMYYTNIGDYIVFGNQAASLRLFIDEYESGSLLLKSDHFESVQKNLPSKGNLFFYTNPSSSTYILKSLLNKDWKNNLDLYKNIFAGLTDFAWQLSADENEYHMSVYVNFANRKRVESVSQSFVVETDSSVFMKPLLTTDPITNTRQLLFQDEAKTLFLVDNSGNIIWKQSIDGKILGQIFEMDLFRNNSRQFLFNTRDYLYMLDIDGRPVGNYPIRLPAPATNGISVFDFEKKKDPKIYIACENKRIYAYLPSGKPLPGWNFQQNTGLVSDPIRSIQFGGKDYLVINDDQGVVIVNKFGEAGISLVQKFTIARNSTFFRGASGSFITTDPAGNVVMISSDGLVQTIPLNAANPDHGFVYADVDNDGDEDYIFLDGKELIAYSKSLTLIYRKEFESVMSGGLYPLTIRDGVSVLGISSVSSNKTWLLNMDGTVYKGFPVKGCGQLVVDEINLDGKKNLFTGSTEKNFNVYSLE